MKKTISINISGVVFNIEEDAYDKLHGYLESIKKYFSSYEGNLEIVADIENRIAEKFFAKLKTDNKQALGMDDVNELIAAMGTVQDFEAIEEDEDLKQLSINNKQSNGTQTSNIEYQTSTNLTSKKLYRDTKRKILGGVCGGLAHYFAIDIVWIRIAFLLLFFLPAPIDEVFVGISAFAFLGYFAYWVAFPANGNLEDDLKIKKFYRSVDEKVIGGVATGLAAYFGLDKGLVRFLFVIAFMFFGVGFMAYLLLWITAPKAASLTQKMEMKGEPVTLSNIEENVKQSLNIAPNEPESGVAKLLLLPFRIISAVVEALGKIFKNLGPIVRILAGILLFVIGGAFLFAVVVSTGVFGGIISESQHLQLNFGDFSGSDLIKDIKPEMLLFGFWSFGIPAFSLLIAGLSLVLNKTILNKNWWGIMLGLWLIGVIGTAVSVGDIAQNFAKPATVEKTQNFDLNAKKVLVLDMEENQIDDWQKGIWFSFEGTDDKTLKITELKMAKGRTRQEAEQFASAINYNITQKDSILVFNERFSLPNNAPFRNQKIKLKLYIPYNQSFNITSKFHDGSTDSEFDWNKFDGIDWDNAEEVKKLRFVMQKGTGLRCLNCPESKYNADEENDNGKQNLDELFSENFQNFEGNFVEKKVIEKFSSINVAGNCLVKIEKGTSNKVSFGDENDDLKLKVVDGVLQIIPDDNSSQKKISVSMTDLNTLKASGNTIINVKGFETKELKIDISGEAALKLDAVLTQIFLDISGSGRAYLWGKTNDLKANVSGDGELSAYHLETENAQIESSGESLVYLRINKDLKANATGSSKVRYRTENKKNNKISISGDVQGNDSSRKYDE